MNTEHLFLNFPKEYFTKMLSDKKIDNMKAYEDGAFLLIKGENSFTISHELFEHWCTQERIKKPEHIHLVRMVDMCVEQLGFLGERPKIISLN